MPIRSQTVPIPSLLPAMPPGALPEDDFQRRYFDAISLFTPQAKLALYQPAVAARLKGIDSFAAAARHCFERRPDGPAHQRHRLARRARSDAD